MLAHSVTTRGTRVFAETLRTPGWSRPVRGVHQSTQGPPAPNSSVRHQNHRKAWSSRRRAAPLAVLSPSNADTLTSQRELSARALPPLIILFRRVPPNLPCGTGSCAAGLEATPAFSFYLRAAPGGVQGCAVNRGVLLGDETLELTHARSRVLHRVAVEPVAWQFFFVVVEQP